MAERVTWSLMSNKVRFQTRTLIENFIHAGLLPVDMAPTVSVLKYENLAFPTTRRDLRTYHQLLLTSELTKQQQRDNIVFSHGFVQIDTLEGEKLLVPVCSLPPNSKTWEQFENKFDIILSSVNDQLLRANLATIPLRRMSL